MAELTADDPLIVRLREAAEQMNEAERQLVALLPAASPGEAARLAKHVARARHRFNVAMDAVEEAS